MPPNADQYSVALDCLNCGSTNYFDLDKGKTVWSYGSKLRCAYCKCTTINTASGGSPVYAF